MERTWIAYGNRDKYRHAEALEELGFVCWRMYPNIRFSVGDIVYLFVSDKRQINYKLKVVAKNYPRVDFDYWIDTPKDGLTYKLELVGVYHGDLLKDADLEENGLKKHSLEHPFCNNVELISYVDSVFAQNSVHISASWLISSNPKRFDVRPAFRELDSVLWIQSQPMANIKTGDVVYIYESGEVGRIVLKCKVGKTKLPYSSDVDKDMKYWREEHPDDIVTSSIYMELFLLQENETPCLTLQDLRDHGEKSNMQGAHRLSGDYLEYIDSCFFADSDDYSDDDWFEQLDLNTKDRIRHVLESEKVIEAKHQKMQEAIKPILEREGYENVVFEEGHVDIRAKKNGIPHFFEVKTYDTAKACIREALGQILEYNHYPNYNWAAEMYIVGPVAPDPDDIVYLSFLRSKYNLRLYYRAYLINKRILSSRV